MTSFRDAKFIGQDIQLDENDYENCVFQSCRFIYEGRTGIRIKNSDISQDCSFLFRGFAGNTVATMKMIYGLGDWGRNHIIATFEQIAPDLKNLH